MTMGGGRTWPVKAGTIKGDQLAFTIDRDGSRTSDRHGVVKDAKIAGVAAAMGTTVAWEMDRAKRPTVAWRRRATRGSTRRASPQGRDTSRWPWSLRTGMTP